MVKIIIWPAGSARVSFALVLFIWQCFRYNKRESEGSLCFYQSQKKIWRKEDGSSATSSSSSVMPMSIIQASGRRSYLVCSSHTAIPLPCSRSRTGALMRISADSASRGWLFSSPAAISTAWSHTTPLPSASAATTPILPATKPASALTARSSPTAGGCGRSGEMTFRS